jgi:hypothetical protein
MKGACGGARSIEPPEQRSRAGMVPIVGQRLDYPPPGHLVRLFLVRRQRFLVGGVRAGVRRVIHGAPGAYPNATGFGLSKP